MLDLALDSSYHRDEFVDRGESRSSVIPGSPPLQAPSGQDAQPDGMRQTASSKKSARWRSNHSRSIATPADKSVAQMVIQGVRSGCWPISTYWLAPSSACPTVLLCILDVQRPRGVFVSGGSSRQLGLSSRVVSQLPYRTPSRPPTRKAKAWADRRRHSGVVPSSPVGRHVILTITLSPADQSRRAGWDDGSATTSRSIGLVLPAPRVPETNLRSLCGVAVPVRHACTRPRIW